MNALADPLAVLREVNKTAAFNRWCGIEVIGAKPGEARNRHAVARTRSVSTPAFCMLAWSAR
jgi:hypothetical protein